MAQRTFLGQLKELEDKLERVQPEVLKEVAHYLVSASPDDTGAYILSHTIGRSGNVGLSSLNPENRPSAPNTHRQEAEQRLLGQVAGIPPDTTRVFVGNNAPHAYFVENGGYGWETQPYKVYGRLRQLFPSMLQDAKNRLGLK